MKHAMPRSATSFTTWGRFLVVGAPRCRGQELLADFGGVAFRADIALERVKLEDGLLGFMQQSLGAGAAAMGRSVGGW